MNEAETRAEHIDPALNAAGWGVVEGSKMLREYTPGITFDPLQPSDGRLVRIRCIARSLQHIGPRPKCLITCTLRISGQHLPSAEGLGRRRPPTP